ncbi:hypothetical protein HDU85_003356 [Gaertneriomyces sp. JEL0708]|nr:hypothetical protein HDU85_003356 [Gaertneriomyces sp. JEL0708]
MADFNLTSHINEKSRVPPEEKERLYNHVVWEGTKASMIGGALATAGLIAAHKASPTFARVSLPFKVFLGLAATTATFFTVSDRASGQVAREAAARWSANRNEAANALRRELSPIVAVPEVTGAKEWFIKHRYPVVAAVWTGALGGTLLYNAQRGDITRSQKIINARLLAQVMALCGVGAIAGLTATESHEIQVDRHWQSVMQQGAAAKHHPSV